MKIEHLAIWVDNLEKMKQFYMKYFQLNCGEKYENHTKSFSSYFLYFESTETRIELMNKPDILTNNQNKGLLHGLSHFALSVGNKQKVDELTEHLRNDGYTIASEPRTTGDGFYESVILDPEGNNIEITE